MEFKIILTDEELAFINKKRSNGIDVDIILSNLFHRQLNVFLTMDSMYNELCEEEIKNDRNVV